MEQELKILKTRVGHGTGVENTEDRGSDMGHWLGMEQGLEIIRTEFGHGTGAGNNQKRVWTWNRG